uniref:Mitochondrial import receptor subunit TOM7 homolog n=1 Tax=Daphnia galeata TaxID=27404 RepID=A0A8J2RUC7_9CRUS|nr:unnamed protein product [Daphnia galeata]
MAKLSPDTKRKLTAVVNVGKTIFHWSFIPTVLYLGFRQGTDPGMPPITIMRYMLLFLKAILITRTNHFCHIFMFFVFF